LQKFVRVFEKIPVFVAGRTQRFSGQLRRNFNSCNRGILGDVADFVDLDAGFTSENGFQLFCERRWLGVAAGKRANEARELRLR